MNDLWASFIPAFYAKAARQTVSSAVRFLLLFVLLVSSALSLRYTIAVISGFKTVSEWADSNLAGAVAKLPVIEIKNSVLVQPDASYAMNMGNDFVFSVEPDPAKETQTLAKYNNTLMLASGHLVFKLTGRDGLARQEERPLADIRDLKISPIEKGLGVDFQKFRLEVTPGNLKRWLKIASIWTFPFFLAFLFLTYSLSKFFQIFFFSLFGLLAKAIFKAEASYRQIFNICVYGLVPPVSLAVVVQLIPLVLPGFWFLFSAVYILYIFLGVQAVKTEEKTAE